MKKPTMTVAEAEAAVIAAIGPRPISVKTDRDNDNRKHVRRWLAARGLPRAFADGLSKFELQAAFNDAPTTDDGFKAITRKYEIARQDHDADDADEKPAYVPYTPDPDDEGHIDDLERAIQGIAWRVAQRATPKASVDESRVLELIKSELDARTLPRPIVVKLDNKPAVELKSQHPLFERVLRYVVRGANVMLVGPAGCGKTHLCEQIAKALSRDYAYISGTAGVSESAITGWLLPADGGRFEYTPSDFVKLYERGNAIILLDEMDAFDPNMVMVANTATANGHMTVPHRHAQPLVRRGNDVAILATCNTYGTGANPLYSARNPLDGATLDRWIVITMDYDRAFEEQLGLAGGLTASEMSEIWKLRDKVRETQVRRVISTRALQKAILMKDAGDDWKTVMATLTEGWTKDEKAKAGLQAA